jgi:hypothetical protein
MSTIFASKKIIARVVGMNSRNQLPDDPFAIPTAGTDIAQWKREVRALKRRVYLAYFLSKFSSKLRIARLRFRMLALSAQMFLLKTPEYLTAILLIVFRRHLSTPPDSSDPPSDQASL